MNLRKLSKSTSFNAPPDMKSAYAKVLESHITHDENYLRVTQPKVQSLINIIVLNH